MASEDEEHRAQDVLLSLLDPLGDLDLALAGEQRDRAHLAQVHAHRVVALAAAGVEVVVAFSSFSSSGWLGASMARGGLGSGGVTLLGSSTILMSCSPNIDMTSSI